MYMQQPVHLVLIADLQIVHRINLYTDDSFLFAASAKVVREELLKLNAPKAEGSHEEDEASRRALLEALALCLSTVCFLALVP